MRPLKLVPDLCLGKQRTPDGFSEEKQLKVEMGDLDVKRQVLKRDILADDAVVDGYGTLPAVLDEAQRAGTREELQALLRAVIDVVEWRQDPADAKKGEAHIKLFPLSEDFWRLSDVNKPAQGSWGCPTWLPICDRSRTKGLRLRFVVAWSDAVLGVERTSKRRLQRAARLAKGYRNPIAKARRYEAAIADGTSQADVARRFGVTRQEVCQHLTLLRLPVTLVDRIENPRATEAPRRWPVARLLTIARMSDRAARARALRELCILPAAQRL